MKNQIKIWFYSGNSSHIREISLRKSFLLFSMLLFFACAGAASYFGYDYYLLNQADRDNTALHETIAGQKSEIEDQRRQIQMFAGDVITSYSIHYTKLYDLFHCPIKYLFLVRA